MLAMQITSMKNFMSQLLVSDAFDIFLLEEASISAANTVTIDGRMNRDFFPREELETGNVCPYEFAVWSDLKKLCFQLIKGKRTPLAFKFVMHLKPEQTEALLVREECGVEPSQIKALVLTIKYDGEKAVLTTGTAYRTFLPEREPDRLWDRTVAKYLTHKGIGFELL